MCGRFVRTTPVPLLAELFLFPSAPDSQPPHYNIAPTQTVAAVRVPAGAKQRELALLRWGLIPSWAADLKIGNRLINARSETAATKPAFRSAFRQRRCLILADGFYEWKTVDGKKQPYFIHMQDRMAFAFAGLWESYADADRTVESCTILTTAANELMRSIHERMPVILERDSYEQWLDPRILKPELVQGLLGPYRSEAMSCYPVSTLVNNPRNDSPDCMKPLK
jgi:putative SOS response-associated peptidase YedK